MVGHQWPTLSCQIVAPPTELFMESLGGGYGGELIRKGRTDLQGLLERDTPISASQTLSAFA